MSDFDLFGSGRKVDRVHHVNECLDCGHDYFTTSNVLSAMIVTSIRFSQPFQDFHGSYYIEEDVTNVYGGRERMFLPDYNLIDDLRYTEFLYNFMYGKAKGALKDYNHTIDYYYCGLYADYICPYCNVNANRYIECVLHSGYSLRYLRIDNWQLVGSILKLKGF